MGKIIVDKIELKNFFSYGNAWQSIDLREGVNIVLGHDKDKDRSNGAGKTSFLEAIPFALFGQTSKGVALGKIVNWKNGKQCEVKLHFHKDGVPYIIHRGVKPGILELYKGLDADGNPQKVPKLSDKRVFQMELEQDLIGMDFKAAEALLFQNANNMVSIFNTPKGEKRRFIEKFFNLEVYSKQNEHVNGKLGNINKRISEIDMEIGFKRRRIDELSQVISSTAIPDMDAYKKSLDRAVQELESHVTEYGDIAEEIELIQELIEKNHEWLQTTKSERHEAMLEVGRVEDEINKLCGENTALNSRVTAIGDLSEQRVKLEKIKAALTTMEGLEGESKELTNEISQLREDLSKEKQSLAECNVYRNQYKADIEKTQGIFITEEAMCPTCFQEVDRTHITDHIHTQISGFEYKLSEVEGKISGIGMVVADIEMYLQEKGCRLADIDLKITKKRQLEKHLATLSGVEEKEKELSETQERIRVINDELRPTLEDELDVCQAKVDGFQHTCDGLEIGISEKNVLLGTCKDMERGRAVFETNVETEQKIYDSQKVIHDKTMEIHKSNVESKDQLTVEVSEFDKETKKLERMKDYLEYIKGTLKDENVKQYAIGNIIPYLQQQTNHYLSETGHNYYVELDAWLDGTIKGYGVGECDFGNMSGGEGKSIDLALKFAMMDVARRQAGSYLDVLVLDELLDSSIDSHGIEKTFDIIKLKQREDNLKVFVVSHREEVADFGSDNTYKVTKEDGFSTIEV